MLLGQGENSTHCAHSVNGFSCDTSTSHSVLCKKVPKDLHGLLPIEEQVMRTCTVATNTSACGALAA